MDTMKLTTTILFLLVLFLKVDAQVLVLQTLNNEIVVGPNNVTEIDKSVCLYQIDKIRSYYKELALLKKDKDEKRKLAKKKKKIKTLELEIKAIELEFKFLNEINQGWLAKLDGFEKLDEFYALWQEDNCYKIISENDTFFPENYIVELEDSIVIFSEFFNVNLIDGEEYWDKVKKVGCNSKKEDCYVYCLKRKPDSFHFKDMQGKEVDFIQLTSGYEYFPDTQLLARLYQIKSMQASILIKSKTSGQIIEVQSWELIDCQ